MSCILAIFILRKSKNGKAISIVNKMPLSVTTALAISLAGGFGVAINSFTEFWVYLARKRA